MRHFILSKYDAKSSTKDYRFPYDFIADDKIEWGQKWTAITPSLSLNLGPLPPFFFLSAGKKNKVTKKWYTTGLWDSSSIHLHFKAACRVVVPHCWGIRGRKWRRREIPGILSWDGVEQPVHLARALLFVESPLKWTKN